MKEETKKEETKKEGCLVKGAGDVSEEKSFPFPYATNDEDVTAANSALKKELWSRGYYVMEIGDTRFGKIDYLVVSACEPKAKVS